MSTDIEARIDVCGVCCPLPLIMLAKAVKSQAPGHTIEVVGNDPIFETSVRDFCNTHGHSVLDTRAGSDRRVTMLIRLGNNI